VKKAVEKCRGKGYSESYVRPTAGCKAALRVANPSDLIVVTGSLYMVGEVRDYIIKNGGSAVVKEEES
jgi:folylpolyglutamate synthase/dihydropteroate synthase